MCKRDDFRVRNGAEALTAVGRTPIHFILSVGRTAAPRKRRKAAGEESPGSMDMRCRITSGGGDPRESATENKPPAGAFGKGG